MIRQLTERYPVLAACTDDILEAQRLLTDCFREGGKLLLCGNGGSCADCEHIVGELMKGFLSKRPLSPAQRNAMRERCAALDDTTLDSLQNALPAIALPSMTALNSAFCNDVDPRLMYAQTLMGLGREGDVLLGISTSGNSENVCAAAAVGRALGLKVIGLTGVVGGRLAELSDVCIRVPETETYKVQELHLPVYHYLCAAIEQTFFG